MNQPTNPTGVKVPNKSSASNAPAKPAPNQNPNQNPNQKDSEKLSKE